MCNKGAGALTISIMIGLKIEQLLRKSQRLLSFLVLLVLAKLRGGAPVRVVPLLGIIWYIEIYYKVKYYIQQIPYS